MISKVWSSIPRHMATTIRKMLGTLRCYVQAAFTPTSCAATAARARGEVGVAARSDCATVAPTVGRGVEVATAEELPRLLVACSSYVGPQS